MILDNVLTSFAFGLVATAAMTSIEVVFWKRWGLEGVFEWHENQVITERVLKISKRPHFAGIFFWHFLNGGLGGVGFFILSSIFPNVMPIILYTGFGFFLWLVTLIPIHKPITGLDPWNHPLGKIPPLASLGGHFVYGVVLGILFFNFITQSSIF
ncbi:MAG TPA: hypothetical protein VD699_06010 [Nitrosopumilaceae archaeon]|nr:hypothetical protein [Nitrosopumilaceae archaeon]HXV39104.1 hypothetical protein [Nitrosopumilaceae archaeon]